MALDWAFVIQELEIIRAQVDEIHASMQRSLATLDRINERCEAWERECAARKPQGGP